MIEQLDVYFDWLSIQFKRKRPPKFRDEDAEPRNRKLKPRQLRPSGWGVSARRTLVNLPEAECQVLLREAGLSWKLLSRQAINQLEMFFKREITHCGLDKFVLSKWLAGEVLPTVSKVLKAMRGRIFEEIVTREFVGQNPDFFLSNPNLTRGIVNPLLAGRSSAEFCLPDHLVFSKGGAGAILVGFMEDKKAIGFSREEELIGQLEKEWNLWNLLASDIGSQGLFRREVINRIPSFPHRVGIAPAEEGKIWLATTKETPLYPDQVLPWVEVFRSAVSSGQVDSLTDIFIRKRFLPRLLSDGN